MQSKLVGNGFGKLGDCITPVLAPWMIMFLFWSAVLDGEQVAPKQREQTWI